MQRFDAYYNFIMIFNLASRSQRKYQYNNGGHTGNCLTCRVQCRRHFSCLTSAVSNGGRQVIVMASGSVSGVVSAWPRVGVEGGARLSDPVEVIIGLLLPVTASLLKVTHICK